MSPDQAVQKLRDQGFISFERTWTLGHSIAVGVKRPGTEHHAVDLVYLYPSGERWNVIDMAHLVVNDQECRDLDEAVEQAIRHLRDKSHDTAQA